MPSAIELENFLVLSWKSLDQLNIYLHRFPWSEHLGELYMVLGLLWCIFFSSSLIKYYVPSNVLSALHGSSH